ncbi:MAG: 23S rRNA (pseudouridine(1915)-N(3))-methyltransferase RlmH [Polyangiaceae bacterium]|nr:23S rRNA (pseudouridine(1915)-N(3))-methyltransferase RlmH [Polyangiaceae bacterium]MCW5791111.1 23S rRNA (pseudouridine(1915)-N(3))-methyltransferase RlmH [Polyangiaceae bacterium]
MRIRIVAVGKLKERALREVLDDYLGRIRRYAPVEELELRDASGFERALATDERVVALEVNGEALTSRALATRVAEWGEVGKGRVSFLIGGAEGIPAAVSRAAQHRLSLSSMTLPHRLARVLLAEQLYRAFTILRGEPYARED